MGATSVRPAPHRRILSLIVASSHFDCRRPVRRGEYRCPLPTGLVYDQSGNVALDPDQQIRETIAHFFETFSRVGSACQTVKVFRNEGLFFSFSSTQ
jgi:hypothetical protein